MEKKLKIQLNLTWHPDRIHATGETTVNGIWKKSQLLMASKDMMEAAIKAINDTIEDVKDKGTEINELN